MEKEKLLVSCFLSTHQHLINTSVAVSFLASWSLGTHEYVTTIVPLFSICSLHFTLPQPATVGEAVDCLSGVLLADI